MYALFNLLFFGSQKMQKCAEKVLVQDMELFSKLDISAKLWQLGHYPIIEALRGRSGYTVLSSY